MKLAEIAARISAHLKRFEADRKGINKDSKGNGMGLRPYYGAWCFTAGSKVGVTYVSYQGHSYMSKADALRYLAMLDAGYVGRHYEALREPRG